jgi:LysR family hydrogen peroxide-inducible transcriptional activator
MELRHLTYLLAVAEHGSFSAAARAIHTVQSNVSTHIAQLESDLGATLIDRKTGRLTDEGEAAVARARRVRAEIAALESDVAALRDEVVGSVRLGVIGSISRWLVPELVTSLRERYPLVHLVLVDATTTSLLPQLLDGTLDLAVINLPVADPRLTAEPLFSEERVLVAPAGHALASKDRLTLSDLADHPLVMEPRGTAFRDELDQAARAVGVELEPVAEVDGMTLVASLAFREFGPAVLPTTALVHEPPGDWVRVPIADLRHRSVGFARRRSARLTAPARAVLALVHDLLGDLARDLDGIFLAES